MGHSEEDKEGVRTFIHDISSPILIMNLAVEELEGLMKAPPGAMDPNKLGKLTAMLSKNLKRLNQMISEFREKNK
jgi:hypothetical protein